MTDWVVVLRIIERCTLTVAFIGIVIFLLYLYRRTMAVQNATIEVGAIKIATAVTLPIVTAALLLGYTYLSLSNPLSLKSADGRAVSEARLFQGDSLSRTFTDVARRNGVAAADLVRAQAALRLSIQVEELRTTPQRASIDALLENAETPLQELKEEIDERYDAEFGG